MKTVKTEFGNRLLSVQRSLQAFALKLTSDTQEANDLVQDTTLKALNNADKFVDNDNFKGWMFTIMRNTFLNNCRSRRASAVSSEASIDISTLQALNLASSAPGPESIYTVKEINRIISKLPEGQKAPFILFLQGYRYEEIATKLQMPLGIVKSHIFRTRRKLRSILRNFS
jgi:RNA polymerase sigma-70 factor (ECF subfamily)